MMTQLESHLKEKDDDRQNVQSELDDLLMVFSDVEEKAKLYKVSSTPALHEVPMVTAP
jgi:hypothetical protein